MNKLPIGPVRFLTWVSVVVSCAAIATGAYLIFMAGKDRDYNQHHPLFHSFPSPV